MNNESKAPEGWNTTHEKELRETDVSGAVCNYCKGKGKIFHWEFGQFVSCGVCRQTDRQLPCLSPSINPQLVIRYFRTTTK